MADEARSQNSYTSPTMRRMQAEQLRDANAEFDRVRAELERLRYYKADIAKLRDKQQRERERQSLQQRNHEYNEQARAQLQELRARRAAEMRSRYSEIKALERRSQQSKKSDVDSKQASIRAYKCEIAVKKAENRSNQNSRISTYKYQISNIKKVEQIAAQKQAENRAARQQQAQSSRRRDEAHYEALTREREAEIQRIYAQKEALLAEIEQMGAQ